MTGTSKRVSPVAKAGKRAGAYKPPPAPNPEKQARREAGRQACYLAGIPGPFTRRQVEQALADHSVRFPQLAHLFKGAKQ